MTIRVGINGFGRIGRSFLRAIAERGYSEGTGIEVVGLNDITSARTNAHLLRHDSTQGTFRGTVEVDDDGLLVDGHRISVFAEREPASIPWGEVGAEVVLEATGRFTARPDAAGHLKGGARRVIVTAPSPDADATFVVGVNDGEFDPDRHVVVSNASCTTNCFAPMVKVLDDAFGIVGGLMTTVHAYTQDQNLLDGVHRDLRRSRAAAINIVPATTGAARSTATVLSAMKGRLDGQALRVPVPVGSITDFTTLLDAVVTPERVNEAFSRAAADPSLQGILDYSDEPLVSSDIVGNPASCVFDSGLTMAQAIAPDRTLVKVQGWYDNEWGFSNRLVDLVTVVCRTAR